jgi:phosphate transport system permease protein
MEQLPFDPTSPLTASGNLRRRQIVNRVAEACTVLAALMALAALGIVIYTVIHRGAPVLSLDFLVKAPPEFGGPGGGIAPYIVGTAMIVAVATALALPVGVLLAIFMTEFSGRRTARAVRLILDLMNGLPSIIIALFIYRFLVIGHGESGFAGSVALSIIMLPLIARATQEVLLLVPHSMREAADALGVSRWRTILTVVLPTAMGGIVTATVLAVARAAGETAPLLLTTSVFAPNTTTINIFGQAVPNIPLLIFTSSESADPTGFARAWGAAFVLLAFILLASLSARMLLARSRAKLKQS